MNYNYTFLLGWRAQLSTRKIFLSYRTRNISNTYTLFFPTCILFNLTLCFPPLICFKLFPALLDWYEWSSTTFLFRQPHVPLDSPHFYSQPEGDTWSLRPAITTEFTDPYFITKPFFSTAFDIWATCSSHLKFTFVKCSFSNKHILRTTALVSHATSYTWHNKLLHEDHRRLKQFGGRLLISMQSSGLEEALPP